MATDPKSLEAQANEVGQLAAYRKRVNRPMGALAEAEITLRRLHALAGKLQERCQDEEASDDIANDLLLVLRFPVSS